MSYREGQEEAGGGIRKSGKKQQMTGKKDKEQINITFVDKEVGEVLLNQNGVGSMRIVIRLFPFIRVLFRMELHAVYWVLLVFEAGNEL
jgi:hypothetical protein